MYVLSRAYFVVFTSRDAAGRLLAQELKAHRDTGAVVVGIARGGIVVASAIAQKLSLPLSFVVIKKIPSPTDPELAIGAIAPDNVTFIDSDMAERVGADTAYISSKIAVLQKELQQRLRLYTQKNTPEIQGKTVILVDDGIATGATVKAALLWLRRKNVRSIFLAVPVMATHLEGRMREGVDALIVLAREDQFASVGQFYRQFTQVDDRDVVELLRKGGEDSKIGRR